MDSILVFGAGELQISLIKTIKKMGFTAVVIDPDPHAPGNDIANFFSIIPSTDFEATVEIAKKHKIVALVTSATDNPVPMMARVAEHQSLIFPSYDSVMNVLDKSKFKHLLLKNRIPCAKGRSYQTSDFPNSVDVSFPVIVKPNRNSGSRGVIKCDSLNDLYNILPDIVNFCTDGYYIIEEFISGDEISVEAFVYNNQLEIVQITDKIVSPPPYNVEMAHIQPSKYYDRKLEIHSLVKKIVEVTGLDNCALHAELKINDRGIYIIEVGPRLGGDYITSDLVPLSTGISMEEAMIEISIGITPKFKYINRASMIQYISLPAGTIVHHAITEHQVKEMSQYVQKFRINIKPGGTANEITSSLNRHGFVVMSCLDKQDLLQKSKSLLSMIWNML